MAILLNDIFDYACMLVFEVSLIPAQDQNAEDPTNIPSANYVKLVVSQRGMSPVCVYAGGR